MMYHFLGITWLSAQYVIYLLPLLLLAGALLIRRLMWQRKIAKLLGVVPRRKADLEMTTPRVQGKALPDLEKTTLRVQGKALPDREKTTPRVQGKALPDREMTIPWVQGRALLKALLLFVALAALVAALARPAWDDVHQEVAQEGRDVLIALDVSRSMLAQDVSPSRLEAAKNKIKQLVGRFGAERVALLVFSGFPVLQCPFTTDIGAFLTFLDAVDAESMSHGSTAFNKALEKGIETFTALPTKKHKIMVIVTDGEDFSKDEGIAKKVQEAGLTVFTVGIGTPEGAPIPLTDEQGKPSGHVKDEKGVVVITRLDEALLKKIASQTGARYVHAKPDESDINQLVSDVKRFEKEKFGDRMLSTKQEKYYIFAAISFVCLLVEWLL